MAPTTVLIDATSESTKLVSLVRDLDAQTLPYGQFDVVFVGTADSGDALRQQVDVLSSHRPNVRFLTAASGKVFDPSVLEQLSSRWLLPISGGLLAASARLRPSAIHDVVSFAESHGCDLVIARTELADAAMHGVFRADVPDAVGIGPELLLDPFLVLYRAEAIRSVGLPAEESAAQRLLESAGRVGVFSGSACLTRVKADLASPAPAISFEQATCAWQAEELVIEVTARVDDAPDDPDIRFTVRNADSGDSHYLAADANLVDGALRATARLDVRSAAAGSPLDAGVWTVGLAIHGSSNRWTRPLSLPVAVQPAIVDGLLVSCPKPRGKLTLDIGATKSSIVPRFDASAASIKEGPDGTVLTVPMPGVHVAGRTPAPGYVLLDKFPLRAHLVPGDAGSASLVCRLSGLAGTPAVATRFGRGPAAATGLALDISAVGQMSLVRAPRSRPAAAPAVPPTKSVPGRPETTSFVQRARRRVPKSVEPAVRALARNESARRLYRRLAGKPARR